MNIKDCIEFAIENPICFLATTEGDQPRVRAMAIESADETGYTFATLSLKEISRQLRMNPKVEVCFYNNSTNLMESKIMRICGSVEFIDEPQAMENIAKTRDQVNRIAGEPVDPYVEIFKITSGNIHFWSVKDVMKEENITHIKF